MRRKQAWVMILLLVAVILFVGDGKSAATNYDVKIKNAEQQQKENEKKAKELEKEIAEIEKTKEDTLLYIEKLDKKVSELKKQIAELQGKITKEEASLAVAKQELSVAKSNEKNQYISMKKRIKYMYENGNQEYMEILFEAESFADFLNRTEYVEKIGEYDQKIFENYQNTKDLIQRKNVEIENSLITLEGYKTEVENEKVALESLKTKKNEEIKKYNEQISISEEQAQKFAKKAAEAEKEVEELLKKKQEELDRQNNENGGNTGGDGTLRWPLLVNGRISSYFGNRTAPTAGASTFHKGIDIAAPEGTSIVAAGDGTVVTATYSSSAGNYIMLSHGDSLYTVYMHCSSLEAMVGETVKEGEVIAHVGNTGISTGPHLHFGVMKNGEYVNPLNYVSQ